MLNLRSLLKTTTPVVKTKKVRTDYDLKFQIVTDEKTNAKSYKYTVSPTVFEQLKLQNYGVSFYFEPGQNAVYFCVVPLDGELYVDVFKGKKNADGSLKKKSFSFKDDTMACGETLTNLLVNHAILPTVPFEDVNLYLNNSNEVDNSGLTVGIYEISTTKVGEIKTIQFAIVETPSIPVVEAVTIVAEVVNGVIPQNQAAADIMSFESHANVFQAETVSL